MTTLSGILPPVNVSTATGTLPHNKGGTGLTSAGAAGNVLTSDGDGWVSSPASGGGASVVISETAPASPTEGTVWWDSDTGASYIYYDDGNTAQWVSFSMGETGATGPAGPTGAQGPQGPQGEAGAVTCPQNVQSGNYTLVLADAGKHIYSANSGAQTITIPTNASVAFPIGTLITIVNRGTTQIIVSASGVSVIPNGSASALTYPSLQPNNSVQLLKTGTNIWESTAGTIANQIFAFTFLSIAGGGGGGGYGGGGGGAGGYVAGSSNISPFPTTLAIAVGAGGNGGPNFSNGSNGANTSITGTTIAVGGGGGGANSGIALLQGGSGGGSAGSPNIAGAGTLGQGNSGGSSASAYNGAGGGGAGAVGANFGAGSTGGNGLSSSITGSAVVRGGGGGGGNPSGQLSATGGTGGGGTGGGNLSATSGTANTGGGGGGGGGYAGFAGGSGVVIISSPIAATSTTGSPTISSVGDNTVYIFNSSGSITFF